MGINKKDKDRYLKDACRKQGGEFCRGCGARPHPSLALFFPEYPNVNSKLEPFWIKSKEKDKSKQRFLGIILDHIDNDTNHNDSENHQPLCQSCNAIKNPRGKLEGKNSMYESPPSAEMQRGDEQEEKYRAWINAECTVEHKADFIMENEARYGGAEYLTDFMEGKTISPTTTRKYIKKLTSNTGWYFWYKGFVGLKINLHKLEQWLAEVEKRKQRKVKKLKEFQEAYVKDFKETEE